MLAEFGFGVRVEVMEDVRMGEKLKRRRDEFLPSQCCKLIGRSCARWKSFLRAEEMRVHQHAGFEVTFTDERTNQRPSGQKISPKQSKQDSANAHTAQFPLFYRSTGARALHLMHINIITTHTHTRSHQTRVKHRQRGNIQQFLFL